jgi:hypothetical protein
MKEALSFFFQIMLTLSLACLIIGLIRPVLVLWFMDRFNRLKVIKVYGLLALGWLVLILILK